jgi:CDP-glycerol glycerophosphotransferase
MGEITVYMKYIAYIKKHILLIFMPFLMSVMHFFVRTDDKTILFVSYNGRSYTCNPKAIFEKMRGDNRYADYKLIWGMDKPMKIPRANVVKMRRLRYFYYLSKAKYWVFNSKMPVYYIKKKDQIYLQTWHGTPLKRLAHDMPDTGITYYRSKQSYKQMLESYDIDCRHWDYLISPNEFSTKVFATAFKYPPEKMIETGYPRNDILKNATEEDIIKIKQRYDIPQDKKVILYAPTWRDNSSNLKGYTFQLKVDIQKWYEALSDEYIVLFKPHYLIANHFEISLELSQFFKLFDVDGNINDAYLMADLLITDYSSVFFDYANLNRPIYFYMYDFSEYRDELRGFYLDVPADLPNDICITESELLNAIRSKPFDYKRLKHFNKRFNALQDGHVCKRVIEELLK